MSDWTTVELPGGAVVSVFDEKKTLEYFKLAEQRKNSKQAKLERKKLRELTYEHIYK